MQLSEAPTWLIKACKKATSDNQPTAKPNDIAVDQGAVKVRAFEYIMSDAPGADMGGRNDTAYRVAAHLKDLGADQFTAYDLLSQWTVRRCDAPLDADEVQHIVKSVYRYTKGAVGQHSPEADFEVLPKSQQSDPAPEKPIIDFGAYPLDRIDLVSLPPRRWVLGRQLICANVTAWIAPGGEGKSSLSLAGAFSVITGDSRFTGFPVHETGRVLAINNEDSIEEIARRTYALCQYHNVQPDAINKGLITYSGVDKPFLIARRTDRNNLKAYHFKHLRQFVRDNNVLLIIADPFLETHEGDENSNREINRVGRLYRQIAVECGCAVLLIHHTRKRSNAKADTYVGDPEGGRGASSLIGVARVMSTLYSMSAKDAKAYGVQPSKRFRYVRLDDAKANLSVMSPAANWFRKESVLLPNGDDVGVLVPDTSLTLLEEKMDESILRGVLDYLADEGYIATVQQVAEHIAATVTLKSPKATKQMIIELIMDSVEFDGYKLKYLPGAGRGKSPDMVTADILIDFENQ